MNDDKREALAAYAHEAWSGWMQYMFQCSFESSNGSVNIPPVLVKRWKRQASTNYEDLPPFEQKSDLKEADKILAIIKDE